MSIPLAKRLQIFVPFALGYFLSYLYRTINAVLAPIQERSETLKQKPGYVTEVLEAGGERCRKIASETMREVRSAMGIGRNTR